MAELGGFETLSLSIRAPNVAVLELARPTKSNAVSLSMWSELPQAMDLLDRRDDVRVVILKGQGKNFCGGIDFQALDSISGIFSAACPGRAREAFRRQILCWQDSLTSLERCRWPVLAAVQGACVGAGIDMITAADIRYCSADASFCMKEVDLAIAADMGTLQRLPGIVGEGAARELALTARTIGAAEAKALGLVSEVFPDAAALHTAVEAVAASMAAKSPLAITGTKRIMLHSRDHGVADGLDYVATWNSAQLPSQDLQLALQALALKPKQAPRFAKL